MDFKSEDNGMPQCLQCEKDVPSGLLARHGICFTCCFTKAWEAPVIGSEKWILHSPFCNQDDSQINPHQPVDSSVDWFQSNTMPYTEYQDRLRRMFDVPIPAINGGRGESYENFLHVNDANFEDSKKNLSDIITKMTNPTLLMNYRFSHFPHDELSNVMAAGFLFAPICFDLDDANPPLFRVAGTWRKKNGDLHGCNNPCGSWWALNICRSLVQHRHIYAVQVPWNAIGGVTSYRLQKNAIALVSLTTPQTTSYYSKRANRDASVIFCGGGLQLNCMRTVNPNLPLNFVYDKLNFPSQPQQTSFLEIERYFEIAILVQGLKFLSAQKSGIVCPTEPLSLKEIIRRDKDLICEYPKSLRLELSSIIDSYFLTVFTMIGHSSSTGSFNTENDKNSVLNFFGSRYRRMTELLVDTPTIRRSSRQTLEARETFNLPVEPHRNIDQREKFRNYVHSALYKRRTSLAQFRQIVLLAVNHAVQQRLSGTMKPTHIDFI